MTAEKFNGLALMRSSKSERDQQVTNVEAFRDTHAEEAKPRLKELQQVARESCPLLPQN